MLYTTMFSQLEADTASDVERLRAGIDSAANDLSERGKDQLSVLHQLMRDLEIETDFLWPLPPQIPVPCGVYGAIMTEAPPNRRRRSPGYCPVCEFRKSMSPAAL